MSRNLSYRVWDNEKKEYSDNPFSLDQYGLLYIQDEDGYWEEANEDRFIIEFNTGLEDKNGKMIYEGGIVKVSDSENVASERCFFGDNAVVKSSYKGGAFTVKNWYGEQILNWDVLLERIEVIGNIHENSELLGGEE